jgi:RNA 2',3'-cyclic 3'-phosphodiesterase
MRLFIAFSLNQTFKSTLYQATNPLRSTIKATWVAPQNYHITIQFLGEIASKMVPVIDAKLSEVETLPQPLMCVFQSIAYFPNQNRPKALIVTLLKNPALELLAHTIQKKMTEIDLKPDCPFAPHLTLARFKHDFRIDGMLPGIVLVNQLQNIARFALIQSILSSVGPTYQEIKTYTLEKGS